MYFGQSEANVRNIFDKARAASPCVLFIDEIDSIARARGTDPVNGAAGDRVMNAILMEMDGINPSKQVFVVGATNKPDILDPALLRPGRFDVSVFIGLPDFENRKEILKVTLSKCPLSNDISLDIMAKRTEGYSGADLAGVSKIAARIAIKNTLNIIQKDRSSIYKSMINNDQIEKNKTKEILDVNKIPTINNKIIDLALKEIKPSVTIQQNQYYLDMKNKFTTGFLTDQVIKEVTEDRTQMNEEDDIYG